MTAAFLYKVYSLSSHPSGGFNIVDPLEQYISTLHVVFPQRMSFPFARSPHYLNKSAVLVEFIRVLTGRYTRFNTRFNTLSLGTIQPPPY